MNKRRKILNDTIFYKFSSLLFDIWHFILQILSDNNRLQNNCLCTLFLHIGVDCGIMIIISGIGRGDLNSNLELVAFPVALIPLGKLWIQLFSLQLWRNSRIHWVIFSGACTQSRWKKTLISNLLNSKQKKNDLVSPPLRSEGLVNTYNFETFLKS